MQEDWTPLHGAAEEGNYDVVKFLVGAGANKNARDKVPGAWRLSKHPASEVLS